jgi:predicted PolB exonuclease-like 3'-5' exonuclease
MRYVITDVETAPLADAERMLPEFKHNAGTNDADKRAAQIAEKRAKALADAALDPDLCRIVAIGSWWEDEAQPILELCTDEDDERDSLREFWQVYAQRRHEHPNTVIVGSNVLGFDLPVMVRRSLYLQVDVPMLERGKYRHRDVIDLLEHLSEGRKDHMRSLDYYVRRFALDVPHDPIDGAQIPALVAAGNWDAVREHLRCDLLKTRALALRVVPSLREMAVTA